MKCSFCKDRIDEAAAAAGASPGVDPEVTPACVNSCISGAMVFGDIDDPEQRGQPPAGRDAALPHARGTRHRAGRLLHLGSVMKKPNRPPNLPGQPAPKQQRNWDWRAAANFICGGAGGGLLLLPALRRPRRLRAVRDPARPGPDRQRPDLRLVRDRPALARAERLSAFRHLLDDARGCGGAGVFAAGGLAADLAAALVL
jgi:hypothetical protein